MPDLVSDQPYVDKSPDEADYTNAPLNMGVGAALGAEFQEGPIGALSRANQRAQAPDASWFDRSISDIGMAGAGLVLDRPKDEPMLSPDEVNKQFAPEGTSITDKPMTATLARIVGQQKQEQMYRDRVWQGFSSQHSWPVNFAAGTAAFMLDPLNAGSAFVPGLGEESILARLGGEGIVARMAARAGAGATAGVASQAPLVGLKYGLGQEEASDYSLRDAFKDLAFGAVIGAAGSAVHGGLAEAGVIGPDALMRVNAKDRLAATSAAAGQIATGKPVDVAPIITPTSDIAEVASRQAEQERSGYAPGIPQPEFDAAREALYEPPKEGEPQPPAQEEFVPAAVPERLPEATPRYTLSEVPYEQHPEVQALADRLGTESKLLEIKDPTGNGVGSVLLSYNKEQKNINIGWVSTDKEGSNNLGAAVTRQLLGQIQEIYPDAETIGGNRISGARTGRPERISAKLPRRTATPQSLVRALTAAGGIRDDGGNLKAAGLNRFPGLINNKRGMSPDGAREWAAEQGYLGADVDHAMANTTENDLYDALGNHPTYSVHDEDRVAQTQAERDAKAKQVMTPAAAERSIKGAIKPQEGQDLEPAILGRAAEKLTYGDETDPHKAWDAAAEEYEQEAKEREDAIHGGTTPGIGSAAEGNAGRLEGPAGVPGGSGGDVRRLGPGGGPEGAPGTIERPSAGETGPTSAGSVGERAAGSAGPVDPLDTQIAALEQQLSANPNLTSDFQDVLGAANEQIQRASLLEQAYQQAGECLTGAGI